MKNFEKENLIKNLKDYYDHLIDNRNNTFISKIYGIYVFYD